MLKGYWQRAGYCLWLISVTSSIRRCHVFLLYLDKTESGRAKQTETRGREQREEVFCVAYSELLFVCLFVCLSVQRLLPRRAPCFICRCMFSVSGYTYALWSGLSVVCWGSGRVR